MTPRTLRMGALAGMIAGMMMAMWSMLALAFMGQGFWTPINAIANTVWGGAPLDGTFNLEAVLIGGGLHMALSMMLGMTAFAVAEVFHLGRRGKIAATTGIVAMAWIGAVIVWPLLDAAAATAFTPWVLTAGHVIFAMTLAGAALLTNVERAPTLAPAMR